MKQIRNHNEWEAKTRSGIQAEALDALLDHKPYNPADLDPQDAAFARQVCDTADAGMPVDARFYTTLKGKLMDRAEKRARNRLSFFAWPLFSASLLGGAALLGLLIIAAVLVSRQFGGQQAAPTNVPAAPILGGPTQAGDNTTVPATPEPTATSLPSGGLVLHAALPDSPTEVPVYNQVLPGGPFTLQGAQTVAAQLGINGSLYMNQGEGGMPTFWFSDGKSTVFFFGSSDREFTYMASYAPYIYHDKKPLPFEQISRIGEQWLKDHGQLDFPYHMEPCPTDPECAAVVQDLEGGKLYENNPYDMRINVKVNPAQKVYQVISRPVRVETSGSKAIISAAQAWEKIKSRAVDMSVFYQTLNFPQQSSVYTWYRPYMPGQRVDLYGYPTTIESVDPGQPAYTEVNNLILHFSEASLVPMRSFLHVWGVYRVDENGQDWLDYEGWEPSPYEEVNLQGFITQVDGIRKFQSKDGTYSLPDLPADVPDGTTVMVSGARATNAETIDWRFIQTQADSDSNQSIGTLPLPGAPLEPYIPALPETGYQIGDPVSAEGTLYGTIYQYPDGHQELGLTLNVAPEDPAKPWWTAKLVGDGAKGLETYQSLPVKIQGSYGVENDQIVITVDSYEPVWPGITFQTYFGKVSEQTLEGKDVFILTQEDGKQWVLSSTTAMPQSLAQNGWESGADIVVEGYPVPVEPTTFGGLPILQDLGTGLLFGDTTRENYQPQLGKPQVEMVTEPAESTIPSGTIDKVELVYNAQDFRGPFPEDELPRLVLPFWRFTGVLEDGRPFEVLVLAWESTAP